MQTVLQDVRYALRTLRKAPGFTAVAVLTLAVGIGATTAIFSVVYGVLLRPLPYDKPSQIVRLWEVNGNGHPVNFTDPNFEDLRLGSRSFSGIAEYRSMQASVSGGSEPTRLNVASVSQDFFPLMRVQPMRGRGFAGEDQRFGAAPTALVSYNFWREYLNGTSDLASIRLTVQDQSVSVIGVLPAGFRFPEASDIWMPREIRERLPSRNAHNWRVVGRLRDGVRMEQAHAELATIARRIKQQYGQDVDMTDVALVRLQDALTRDLRPALIVLMAAVGFLLLIACANVINLSLAQAAARERELAIRSAIGAGRARLVRQFLTEAILLSLAGCALGVLMAQWGTFALLRLAPASLPSENISVSLPVLAFALAISLTVSIVLGVAGVLRATSANMQVALAEGGRSQVGVRRQQRLGRTIVAGQIAITLVLLTGAGLLGRSLLRLLSVDPGFRTEHIVTANLSLTFADKEPEQIRRVQFLNDLLAELRTIPGVSAVGGTGSLPLTGHLSDGSYVLLSPAEQPPQKMEQLEQWWHQASRTGYASYCPVSGDYFRVLGIPLIEGRSFDERDTRDGPHVAVVTRLLAQEKWPNQNPIGQRIEFGNMDGDLRPLTVVGVVGDTRDDGLAARPLPTIYVSYRQRPQATYRFTALLKTDADSAAVIAAARKIVHGLDPNLPPEFSSMRNVLALSLQERRFNLALVGAFAGAALFLAMAGLYGAMAYAVAQRTAEFGVRIALGASLGNVLGMVLRQGVLTALVGLAIGVPGALALTRLLRSLLFEVSASDPTVYAAVGALLVAVTLLACYVPARRATKVDPMVALRYE